MSNTFDFDSILSAIDQDSRPPLHLWKPELSGDIDITIDAQGVWRHCGDEFKRLAIPKMFARILCKEQGQYYLKTPVEKWRIQVEQVPFYFIHLNIERIDNTPVLTFISRTEDVVTLDAKHSLRIEIDPVTGEPSPFIQVRDEMEGKLSRNVFYQLAELAEIDEQEQKAYVKSGEQRFCLGKL
jgi:hypothetical protein